MKFTFFENYDLIYVPNVIQSYFCKMVKFVAILSKKKGVI